jgi:hypothetical protein
LFAASFGEKKKPFIVISIIYGASRFGFEFRVVGGKAKGERNETAGWPSEME